jgi:AcrR family transcriptional regulator
LDVADAPEHKYESPRRQEQARETRRRLLDAAYRLFAEKGYTSTSIPAIAHEAGVAVPTVYWAFGSKRALLMALVSSRTVGDEEQVPLAERQWWQEMLEEPDPVHQLELLAAIVRQSHERAATAFEILRDAAASDPEIAALYREGGQRRYRDNQTVAHALAAKGALRSGVTEQAAADVLWAMSASEWYRMFVLERDWSPEQYEAWHMLSLSGFLLPGDILRR